MSPKIKRKTFYGRNPKTTKKQRSSTPELQSTQEPESTQETEATHQTESTQSTDMGFDDEINSQEFMPSPSEEEEITDYGNGQESQIIERKTRYTRSSNEVQAAEHSRKGAYQHKYKKSKPIIQRVSSIESLASLNKSSDLETHDQQTQASLHVIPSSQPDLDTRIRELQQVPTKNIIKKENRISHGKIVDFEFTRQEIERFVEFIKDHPFLYDRKHSDWSNNQLRADKWLTISHEFNQCHPDQCRKLYEKKRTAITKLKRSKYRSGIAYKALTTKEQELIDVWGFLLEFSSNTSQTRDNDYAENDRITRSESPVEEGDLTSNSENENNITPASLSRETSLISGTGTKRKVKTIQKKQPTDALALMEKVIDRIGQFEGTASPTKLFKFNEPKDSREALRHHTLGMLRSVLTNMCEEDGQTAAVKLINYCCELATESKEKKAKKNQSATEIISLENTPPAPVAGTSTYSAPTRVTACGSGVTFSIPTTVSGPGGVPGAVPASVAGPSQQQISPIIYNQQQQNQQRIAYLQAELLKEQNKVQPTSYILDISNSSVGNTSTEYSNPITTIAGTQPFAVTNMYRSPSISSINAFPELYNLSPLVPLTTTMTKTSDLEVNTPTTIN